MTRLTRSIFLALILLLAGTFVACSGANRFETDKDRRMDWWREARFGLFIHWGLYAIPAGKWGEQTHHAEWIRTTAQIPVGEYDQLLEEFNPVLFDADLRRRRVGPYGS